MPVKVAAVLSHGAYVLPTRNAWVVAVSGLVPTVIDPPGTAVKLPGTPATSGAVWNETDTPLIEQMTILVGWINHDQA